MLAAIEKFFIGVFSFLFVQIFVLTGSLPVEEGGVGLPGIVSFLIWIFLMFLFFKVSKLGTAILAGIGYFVMRVMTVGTDGIERFFESEAFSYLIMLVVVIVVLFKLLGGSSSSHKAQGSGTGRTSGHTCPRCNSYLIAVPARQVPTGRYDIRDGDGYWEYDYSTSQTKSRWVVPKVQVPEYEVVPAHYECPNCKYTSL